MSTEWAFFTLVPAIVGLVAYVSVRLHEKSAPKNGKTTKPAAR